MDKTSHKSVIVLVLFVLALALGMNNAEAARTQKDGAVVVDLLQSTINITYELTETNTSATDFNETWENTTSSVSYYFELPKDAYIFGANLTATGYKIDKWNVSTVGAGTTHAYGSMAVDANKRVHICYWDDTNENLEYAYHDFEEPINTWHETVIDSSVGTSPTSCDIDVDSNNYPRILYRVILSADLRYAWYDGSWHTETVDSDYLCSPIAMQIDGNDITHIAYLQREEASNDDETLYYGKKDGSWSIENVETVWDNTGPEACNANVALDIDNSNRPHIIYSNVSNAYYEQDYLKHAYKDGTWTKEIIVHFPTNQGGASNADIDIDDNDDIHVSLLKNDFHDGDRECAVFTEWRVDYYFSENESGIWDGTLCAINPEEGDNNDGAEIAFNDVDGYVYISAVTEWSEYLTVFRKPKTGGSWTEYKKLWQYTIQDYDDKDQMVFDNDGEIYILSYWAYSGQMNLTYLHPHYAINLAMDTGNDGVSDFSQAGKYNNSNVISLNTTAISNFLSGCSADSNGNCNLELNFTSGLTSSGLVQINNINISYIDDISGMFSYNEILHNYGTSPIYVDLPYYNFRNATASSEVATQNIQIEGFNISNYTSSCIINGASYTVVSDPPYRYCQWDSTLSKGGSFGFNITENTTHVEELKSGLACPTGYTDMGYYCERHIELASTTENYYIMKLQVDANYAKDYNITYNISKVILDGWDDGTSKTVLVGGTATDINYTTVGSLVQVLVGVNHSTSSLDSGTHEVEIFYVTPGEAPAAPGSTGGGAPSAPREVICGDGVCEYPETANNCPQDCTAPFTLDVGEQGFTYPAVPGSKIICLGSTEGCDIIVENPTDEEITVKISIEERIDDSYEWAYVLKNGIQTMSKTVDIAPETFEVVTVGVDVPEDTEPGETYSFHIVFESKGQKVFLPYNIQVVESLGLVSQIFTFLFTNIQFGAIAIPGWAIIMLILFLFIILISLSRRGKGKGGFR